MPLLLQYRIEVPPFDEIHYHEMPHFEAPDAIEPDDVRMADGRLRPRFFEKTLVIGFGAEFRFHELDRELLSGLPFYRGIDIRHASGADLTCDIERFHIGRVQTLAGDGVDGEQGLMPNPGDFGPGRAAI